MVSCVFGLTAVGASAATVAPSFSLNTGASIRVEAPAGIRFQTKILKTEYSNMVAKNAEYGTLIIPELALGDNELTVSVDAEGNLSAGENVLIIKADNINTKVEDDKDTTEDESLYIYYNAVVVGEKNGEEFTGLPKEFYGVNLVARSYVVYDGENGKEVEYAENIATRSISNVAKDIIIENSTKYDATDYAFFHDITDYVANQKALSKVTVDKLAETPTCEVEIAGDEVKAVYVLGTDEVVSAENWTYADNKFAFTADYLGTLSYGEYTYKLLTENSVRSLTVKVYSEVKDTTGNLITFNNSDYLTNIVVEKDSEWLPEFEGATGVVRATYSDSTYNGFKFKTTKTVQELESITWDYVEVKVYVGGSGSNPDPVYEVGSNHKYLGSFARNAWRVVRLKKTDIETVSGLDYFYNSITSKDGIELFWAWNAASEDWYIDYVKFGTFFNGVETFDDSIDALQMTFDGSSTYLDSYQGATGVVKGTYTDDYYGVKFKLYTTTELLASLSWDYIEFKMTADFTGSRNEWDGIYSNTAGWTYKTDGVWRIYRATKAGLITQFGSIDAFYTAITTGGTKMFNFWNMVSHGNFYYDYVALKSFTTEISFDTQEESSMVVPSAGWESTYADATGVAVTNLSLDGWSYFGFALNEEFIYALNNMAWTSFEVKLYVPNENIQTDESVEITTPELYMDGAYSGHFDYDTWKVWSIANSKFTDTIKTSLTNGGKFIQRAGSNGNNSTHVYIDYIKLV